MPNTKAAALQVITNDCAAQGERRDIPFSSLFVSAYNMRKSTPTELVGLAALIKAQGGVVQNLIVYPEMKKGKPTGRFGVTAGGRRMRSTDILVTAGDFSQNHPMPCLITTEEKAIELSLVENSGREAPHPADQFEAFRALIDSGREVKDVAAIFGQDELTVYRLLRLANVAPQFINAYRNGEIEKLGVMEALAITTDHEVQIRVWDSLDRWDRTNPHNIRAAIMSDKVRIDRHPVAKFVGAEAYEAAGGHIERDLFSANNEGYVGDFPLLTSLAEGKLNAAAEKISATGNWAWVEIIQKLDYETVNSYPRAKTVERKPTRTEAKAIKTMETEMEKLCRAIDKFENDDDYGDAHDELSDKRDTLQEQIDAAHEALREVVPAHKGLAGVLVGINESGELRVEANRIKPENAKAARSKSAADDDGNSEKTKAKSSHSERLTKQLTAQRTVALQAVVATNNHLALVLLATQLFIRVSGVHCRNSPVKVSVEVPALDINGGIVIKNDAAYLEMQERRAYWESLLIADGADDFVTIYKRILDLPEANLSDLLAFCAASSLDGIRGGSQRFTELDAVATDARLDMSNWWKPTAANYFGFVSKEATVAAMTESGAGGEPAALLKMKKGDLASHAETMMEQTRWIPTLFKNE